MARNTGKRRIHQKPMLLFVDQHLQNGGMGTAKKPLDHAAAGVWRGIGSLNQASTKAQHPAPCMGNGVESLQDHHNVPTVPHAPTCALCPLPASSWSWYSLYVFIEELHNDPGNEEQHGCP